MIRGYPPLFISAIMHLKDRGVPKFIENLLKKLLEGIGSGLKKGKNGVTLLKFGFLILSLKYAVRIM